MNFMPGETAGIPNGSAANNPFAFLQNPFIAQLFKQPQQMPMQQLPGRQPMQQMPMQMQQFKPFQPAPLRGLLNM